MQLQRLMALVLSMLMMLAVLGCAGEPLSTREKGTLLGGVAGAGAHLGVWGTVGIVAGAVGVGLGVGLTRGGGTTRVVGKGGCSPNNPLGC